LILFLRQNGSRSTLPRYRSSFDNGWPPEAHTLYKNIMVRRIGAQKEMPALREFEKEDLLAKFQSDGKSALWRG
jgi:hypothetical protein